MTIRLTPGFDPQTRPNERRALIDLRRSEGRLRREMEELRTELTNELTPVQLQSSDISSVDANLTVTTITQTERVGRVVVFNILVDWNGPIVGADTSTKLILAPEFRPRVNASGLLLVAETDPKMGLWNVATNGVLTFPRGAQVQTTSSPPFTVRLVGSWVT